MGILTEPVLGWRRYGVSVPGLLTSNDCVIMPGERAESYCRGNSSWDSVKGRYVPLPKCKGGPERGCTCGFYAFNSLDTLFKYGEYVQHGVIAEVYMWGRVLRYSKGWRAQFASPKRLWAYGDLAHTCRHRLQAEYGMPVRSFEADFRRQLLELEERRKAATAHDRPVTEQELWSRVEMGDDAATKVLRARLSSAICTRRKSIVRQEKQLKQTKLELLIKTAQRDGLKRAK